MKVKFAAILTVDEALKAVESDGDALQYVLNFDLFVKIAAKFSIDIDQ